MKHLFIPYELALLAKNKGFDEPCMTFYDECEKELGFRIPDEWITNTDIDVRLSEDYDCTAPLHQQIIDWFREKYGYLIWVEDDKEVDKEDNSYYYKIKIDSGTHESGYYSEYYLALDDAIKEAFNLI